MEPSLSYQLGLEAFPPVLTDLKTTRFWEHALLPAVAGFKSAGQLMEDS